MNILVLGGTRFVGRHIVHALLAAGDSVTVFTRGKSPEDLPPSVERLHGDRTRGHDGLSALDGRTWDGCVDVSGYTPYAVRASTELLRARVGRYLFISTVSVYAPASQGPLLESHPLLPAAIETVSEVTGETYGPLKVTCEQIVEETYGDRCAMLRPQIVAGPYDPTGRYTYWVQRAMQPGEMLVPGDGNEFVQVVDARDLGRFAARVVSEGLSGVFNMAGPRLTWRAFAEALGVTNPVWVDAAAIDALGLTFTDLPLFLPNGSAHSSVMDVSCSRAIGAGFTHTDPAVTIRETRDWLRQHPVPPALSPEKERDSIVFARARGFAR